MASNAQKCDESGSKRQRTENEASENPQLSFLDKTDLAVSEDSWSLYNTEPLEKVLNGDVLNIPKVEMNKEIMTLLSKYANIISETAAMEASYIQEMDGILTEARDIENDLKQKRMSLKQRFTVMANTLQG